MKTIKSVYKIGNGPSSSHTVGPYSAAQVFKSRYPEADAFRVTLYGSLAFTGEGHGTQKAIKNAIPGAMVIFDRETGDLPHPNTMLFEAFKGSTLLGSKRIFSIGGGSIRIENEESDDEKEIYPQKYFSEILKICRDRSLNLAQFIGRMEGPSLYGYLQTVWDAMKDSIQRGLHAEGILPGGLGVAKKAKILYEKRCYNESADVTMNRVIAAYAYAVSEENADEHIVVTAPTCGSCGVLPSVMYYMHSERGFPEDEILDALAVAGMIGNVIRTNASISGAECGCQAEIGSACSMTAAALASLYGLNIDQIEYAAEIAMEHNLGLTCDPVNGLVQIPCIERNAVAAMRAISSVNLSRFLFSTRKISFDEVVATMYRTGRDMDEKYRETSHGGLAQIYYAN
ncbi:MAG: L-serine ammonia-lyase, iron-sulfur-dependent, subunit alpha [Clostridia bacterium]|nr:L-serine ammonia-lyase, iron-sulfur-dependent, subunit alpha [Clostridia bacterium]MBQ4452635.1 L-serine ammonia-lyase, iron-sulfur-dependent, subunit alpha [Clostridia bacterium]